jgi:hypothetical protein
MEWNQKVPPLYFISTAFTAAPPDVGAGTTGTGSDRNAGLGMIAANHYVVKIYIFPDFPDEVLSPYQNHNQNLFTFV